jgi:hypothetical protein
MDQAEPEQDGRLLVAGTATEWTRTVKTTPLRFAISPLVIAPRSAVFGQALRLKTSGLVGVGGWRGFQEVLEEGVD